MTIGGEQRVGARHVEVPLEHLGRQPVGELHVVTDEVARTTDMTGGLDHRSGLASLRVEPAVTTRTRGAAAKRVAAG